MSDYETTARTRLRLYKDFGTYDKDKILAIIDAAPFCHVAATVDGSPYVQATRHWRVGDSVYMHGAVKNKVVQALRNGAQACLSFSLFDGYLLTRAAFTHAVLYRSAIAFCQARYVEDLDEKRALLQHSVEGVEKGRWMQIRQPTIEELKQTGVIEFPLIEVSGKALSLEATPLVLPGGELEVEADNEITAWTGVIPYELTPGAPLSAATIIGQFGGSGQIK